MSNAFKIIGDKGVLPVINIEKTEWAVPLAKALRNGGLPLIEVTLRSDASLQAIQAIHEAFPDMCVAAGTVLSPTQADEAVAAGAAMIVAPGFQEKTVAHCLENNVDVLPGCVTPSEIHRAVDMGLIHVKFFPAEKSGGVQAIDLLAGPFKGIDFLPTGGITYDNLQAYLANPRVLACGGSYMAKSDQIRQEAWETITKNCARAMDISLGLRLAHVGLNHANGEEAAAAAQRLCKLLRLPVDERSQSVFSGTYVENMKMPFYGAKGHIGFKTNSLRRALVWLEEAGFETLEESKRFDQNGRLTCVYLKEEIAGFAIHLV